MDGPNYLSAAELGITEDERQKLIDLIPKLRDQTIPWMNMHSWHGCISRHSGIWPNPENRMFSKPLDGLFILPLYAQRLVNNQVAAGVAIIKFLGGAKKPWRDVCLALKMEVPPDNIVL